MQRMNHANRQLDMRTQDSIVAPWIISWLITGPKPQPSAIFRRLLLHSQTKNRTLVLAVAATTIMTIIAAVQTGAAWAYAWVAVEIAFGIARYLALLNMLKEQSSGRLTNGLTMYFGLAWAVSFSIGCMLCVMTGKWSLILLSGMVIAGLAGGISSRNAGTPRFGFTVICILAIPYTVAMIVSPIANMYLIGLLLPAWMLGMKVLLFENYYVLLNLFQSEQENKWLANYDQLTGLPNRTMQQQCFSELLLAATHDTGRGAEPLTVLCLDLDGFKAANDRFGHAIGDSVLMVVAERLRSCVRDRDLIFRAGGDEFVILLPDTSASEAASICERITQRIAEPMEFGGPISLQIGVSVGSATFPVDGMSADALLRAADHAMYDAKRRGNGRAAYSPYSGETSPLATNPDSLPRQAWRNRTGSAA
ncbi:GGDEF domain-containing protein [Rhodopseudomonas sp. HC1]|uniref:GGDEF domain-containing protein n=1 Tax=Rhodopseudomonas infernalis TaxID=2897386 RepID=UPI001EE7BFFF|nr:GGDEF domain-containing protein [Rhodopseudomonas infernalis]MCG6204101.1 GGDEF domain-containing protein [Rhodopseudomonas infernalis]